MKLRPCLALVAAVPAALVFLVILTVLFIPDRELKGVVVRALARQGYTFRAAGFGKAFPLGVAARDLHIDDDRGELLRADAATVRLRLLPLLTGEVVLVCEARIGAGRLAAEISPLGKGRLELNASGVHLDAIPFFATVAGARVKGELRAEAAFRGQGPAMTGELKLEVKGAEVGGVKISELPLPDAAYRNVQGMLRAGGGKLNLESFTLEGDGMYARLKGDLPLAPAVAASPLNLVLELMPTADFLDRQKFVFLLLVKYQKSPGHYEIPIRGTLGRPAIL
jgi:type II secretion system protein N